ncbi:MAG TPA: DUF3179 domain-containing (seleno)protein [Gemmatimonadaceae bacterium]
MKRLFYAGIVGLVLFEVANVYFIMPLPYSQRARSIDLAYFLYSWRWLFRVAFGLMIVAGLRAAFSVPLRWRWIAPLMLLFTGAVVYGTNFKMVADQMFLAPQAVAMSPAGRNVVDHARLVVGIQAGNEARAYPLQFIGYHHQVRDSLGGQPVLVSYCTVCRTGRVFSPVVDGRVETFRLVGMDHFNAMFEDASTRSWWRQATGEAVAGPRKGMRLTELPSQQVTLAQWLALHPTSLIMQPDSVLRRKYSSSFDYETGKSRSTLTGTDTISWGDKAWVIGVDVGGTTKAYDWNRLKAERVIHDAVGSTPIVIVMARDGASFFAFERPDSASRFTLRNDSLVAGARAFALNGHGEAGALKPVSASQEFWHSWKTFHPATATY